MIQIKPVTAGIDIISCRVYQVTKTSTELLAVQLIHYTGGFTAATVTSATPLKFNTQDPASLAVGSTTATGTNATAEPSGGTADIVDEDVWNVAAGGWPYLDIPEGRLRVATAELFGLKLNTAPAASMTIGAVVKFIEYR